MNIRKISESPVVADRPGLPGSDTPLNVNPLAYISDEFLDEALTVSARGAVTGETIRRSERTFRSSGLEREARQTVDVAGNCIGILSTRSSWHEETPSCPAFRSEGRYRGPPRSSRSSGIDPSGRRRSSTISRNFAP